MWRAPSGVGACPLGAPTRAVCCTLLPGGCETCACLVDASAPERAVRFDATRDGVQVRLLEPDRRWLARHRDPAIRVRSRRNCSRGKLQLDSTIAGVLPDLASKYPAVSGSTVEQLARMHSGIPDYGNTTSGEGRRPITRPQSLQRSPALHTRRNQACDGAASVLRRNDGCKTEPGLNYRLIVDH